MSNPDPSPDLRLSLKTQGGDNVATVLDDLLDCTAIAGGVTIDQGIPFGHKVALVSISKGEAILKYGVVIGHAKTAIREGEHVHVHNIA
ncbi:UxaA family hydrolase [Ruegeria sp. EL01]|uniref:UxaA family hydrolase n=1 Tax=Ruegeria sp. EL01 TaxID=2107578 RepID=UPI000EA819B5|nr:UxaA family hydrolase [Ruegeria sp. EL01]